jgi:hypothetical protein
VVTLFGTLITGMLLRYGRHPIDSDSVAQQSLIQTSDLRRQLGTPVQQIPLPSPTTSKPAFLLVYDHDLATLLDPA